MSARATLPSRVGAVFYVIWGILHFSAAYAVYALGRSAEPGMVQGRLYQSAWNLAFFAATATVVAALNWKGSRVGYWVNLFAVSATDVGFILFVLLPGYLPVVPGIAGPVFWILGVIGTTWGYPRGDDVRAPSLASFRGA